MDQTVYAENGEKKARGGRIVAWAITFSFLQLVSLLVVLGLAAWKMPYFNQALATEGSRMFCIIPNGGDATATGPNGEKIAVDAKEVVPPRADAIDKDGNRKAYCSTNDDCATGQICGLLTPTTTQLKDVSVKLAQEKAGTPFPKGKEPDTSLFGWGYKGIVMVAHSPVGLGPGFVVFLLALAIGIPLQRRAMRHLNAVQLSDSERSQLNGEIERMGAGAEDTSRIGRLVASFVGAIGLLVVSVPLCIVMIGAFSSGGGGPAATGPAAAAAPPMPIAGWVVLAGVFPLIGLIAFAAFQLFSGFLNGLMGMDLTRAIFTPIQRGATFGLSKYKISDSEKGALLAEMDANGGQVSSHKAGVFTKLFTASTLGTIVCYPLFFLFLIGFALIVPKITARDNDRIAKDCHSMAEGYVKWKLPGKEQVEVKRASDVAEADCTRLKLSEDAMTVLRLGKSPTVTDADNKKTDQIPPEMVNALVSAPDIESAANVAGATQAGLPLALTILISLGLMALLFLVPFGIGVLIGRPLHKPGMKQDGRRHIIPINEKEQQLGEASFYKTGLWIKRAGRKKWGKLMPVFAIAVGVDLVLSLPMLFLGMDVFHLPLTWAMVWSFVWLPPFVPLIIAMLVTLPMFRKVRDESPGIA